MYSRNQVEQVETNALNGRSLGVTENQLAREARAGLTGSNEATTKENIRVYNQYAHSAHLPEVSFSDGPSATPSHRRHESQARPHETPNHNRPSHPVEHHDPRSHATQPADRDHRPLSPEEQRQQIAEGASDAKAAMQRYGTARADGTSTMTEQQLQQALQNPNLSQEMSRGLRFLVENQRTLEHPEMHGRNSHVPYFYSRDVDNLQQTREAAITAGR